MCAWKLIFAININHAICHVNVRIEYFAIRVII